MLLKNCCVGDIDEWAINLIFAAVFLVIYRFFLSFVTREIFQAKNGLSYKYTRLPVHDIETFHILHENFDRRKALSKEVKCSTF